MRSAWALATKDWPELKLARAIVNLYLGCLHATSDIERSLQVVAEQLSADRRHLGEVTLQHAVLVGGNRGKKLQRDIPYHRARLC